MFRSMRIALFALLPLMCFGLMFAPPARAQLPVFQGSTSRKAVFYLVSSTTGLPVTGLGAAPTIVLSKNGGATAAGTGTVAEIGSGLYSYTFQTVDTNTLGSLVAIMSGTGTVATPKEFNVIFNNPDAAASDTSGTTTLLTRLGTPAGVSISADIQTRMATFTLPANFSSFLITSGGLVRHDLTQPLDPTNVTDTVGGALIGARSQAFGKWVISGSTLTMYAADGTTVLRTFTISPSPSAASRQ